ncbi:MAG: hypothetical protein RLZZ574_2271 [Cyanobacteriota bacterium]
MKFFHKLAIKITKKIAKKSATEIVRIVGDSCWIDPTNLYSLPHPAFRVETDLTLEIIFFSDGSHLVGTEPLNLKNLLGLLSHNITKM